MTQNTSDDFGSVESREENFEEHYRKLMSTRGQLERINIVTELLKKRYEDYEETLDFINFLRSVEAVFAQAENEKWSVEKTQDEMIKGEIYLLSKSSGVDEEVFIAIYDEFKNVSCDVQKIQDAADAIMEKYTEESAHYKECQDFITYVRDSLLVFTRALNGDSAVDEVSEAKEQIIRLRMETMAADNHPPLNILQNIYNEFLEELHK